MAHKIVVIEDEPDIANLLAFHLKSGGYDCFVARDGKKGLQLVQSERPDLVLLDLMLPGMSGTDVCKAVKGSADCAHIPIIMLTARGDEVDRILGFELGADDYVIKPFSPNELVARVKAHIARYENLTGHAAGPDHSILRCGGLEIQVETRRVFTDGKEVTLTNREFELLAFLAANPDIVFSKERLFERVWGQDALGDTATVMVHINRIREKIEPDPTQPMYIETVWGAGYRFHK